MRNFVAPTFLNVGLCALCFLLVGVWKVTFAQPDFVPRGMCGLWTTTLQSAYIAANLAIVFSYFTIPYFLIQIAKTKASEYKEVKWTYVWFAAFIFFCGGGHLIENVLSFWWPHYRFFTLWHMLTAIASVGTTFRLGLALPYLKGLQPRKVVETLLSQERFAHSQLRAEFSELVSTLNADEASDLNKAVQRMDAAIQNAEERLREFESRLGKVQGGGEGGGSAQT